MKRQTFIDYSGVILVSLAITFISAAFGFFQFFLENGAEDSTVSVNNCKNDVTLVIDAGHGGEDGGAVGIAGSLEKDINLEIANLVKSYISLTDINYKMTRDGDYLLYEQGQENRKKFYDLRGRLEICNNQKQPIFLSIHQNKFPLQKYKGLQVYYSKSSNSYELATIIQSKTAKFLQKDNSRKTKEAGRNIYILNNANCPAVLVECGFLSNTEDEVNLNNFEYQKKLAFIMFSSVMDYLYRENYT